MLNEFDFQGSTPTTHIRFLNTYLLMRGCGVEWRQPPWTAWTERWGHASSMLGWHDRSVYIIIQQAYQLTWILSPANTIRLLSIPTGWVKL